MSEVKREDAPRKRCARGTRNKDLQKGEQQGKRDYHDSVVVREPTTSELAAPAQGFSASCAPLEAAKSSPVSVAPRRRLESVAWETVRDANRHTPARPSACSLADSGSSPTPCHFGCFADPSATGDTGIRPVPSRGGPQGRFCLLDAPGPRSAYKPEAVYGPKKASFCRSLVCDSNRRGLVYLWRPSSTLFRFSSVLLGLF